MHPCLSWSPQFEERNPQVYEELILSNGENNNNIDNLNPNNDIKNNYNNNGNTAPEEVAADDVSRYFPLKIITMPA